MNNSNNNINDRIKMEGSEYKFNDVKNEPKPFGFHIATINIPISVVLIKRVWKRRRKTCKSVLKKSYKKKSIKGNVEKSEHVKENVILDPKEFTGDRKWCWDEFERHIGVPKNWDTPRSIATGRIRLKSCGRFIPEAKILQKPKQNDSAFLETDKPRSYCLCPDGECLCFGTGIINKHEKIPKNRRPCLCSCIQGCLKYFKGVSPDKVDLEKFLKQVIAATSASEKQKKQMYKRVKLRKELCLSRCHFSHLTGKLHNIKYTIGPGKNTFKKEVAEEPEDIILEDDRVCNVVYCKVSTQTDNAENGDLIMGDFTHLLYSNNQKTFLNDIGGNKLQISHYAYVRSEPLDLRVCTKNIEKLLNYKEMKVRLRKLISSIYVIKDPGTPVRSNATQVPWRKSGIFKICAPNRCGDEDYENLKEVTWHFKMQEAIFDAMRRHEVEKEKKDDVCPCCEYFTDSIDKNALLENMRNVLTMPGGEKDQLGESITIVKKVIGEIIANAIDDFYEEEENKKNKLLPTWIKIRKALKINPEQNKFVDKEKVKLSKDLPSNNEMNHRSSIKNSINLKAQRISFDTKKTSKDKIVLQVNTSYKKASNAFSSLFKWLFNPSTLLNQIIKTSSVMSVSKDKLPSGTNLNRDAKRSEREVFSIRYTGSAISIDKSISFENDR